MPFGTVASKETGMSVQAGIWNFDGKPVDPNLIAGFNASLKQEGPDGESCWTDGAIVLLYRPFHTTAESRREKQPYITQRGFVVTWDGRLDNRDELTIEFRDYLDGDPTDVALIGAAFDRWETDCFSRVVGDWAVSIWRPRERELLFGTDYMSIRHIFYYLNDDRVWWSTDLSPLLLLSGNTFHIDEDYIAGYFALDPEAHLTPYREIREVPPGQFVHIRNGRACVSRYWSFSPKSQVRYKTDAEYEEHFRHIFRQSVKRRIRSDSPILAELSGGIDSSSIVCMADDIRTKEGAQTPRLDTISYYDRSEPHGDDWIYFPKIEGKRQRIGFHIDVSKIGVSPAALGHWEFSPLPGSLGVERELEAERATVVQNGGFRAVLSGIGGDEFMGGIPDPTAQLADLLVQFKFVKLAQQLVAWSLVKRKPFIQLLWQASLDLLPLSLRQYLVNHAKPEPWLDKSFVKRNRIRIRLLGPIDTFGLQLPTRRALIGGVLLMANKTAKWESPRPAVEEARYPYLDQTLIEFILSIPATQLLRPGERRSLIRRSLVGVVPQEILARKTKQVGSRTPIIALSNKLDELHTMFGTPASSQRGYVNQNELMAKLRAALAGHEVNVLPMLRTISLEIWLRDLVSRGLIDAAIGPPTPVAELSLDTGM
jgi:asparagine synthase (glutamine-hydrolysing)